MLGLREELPEVQTLGSREGSIYSLLMDAAFKQQCRGRSFKWQRSQRRMCQKHKALTKCVFFATFMEWGVQRRGGEEQEKQNFCLVVVLEVVALQVLVSLLWSCRTQGWGSGKVFSHPSTSPRCHSEPSHSNKSFKDYGRRKEGHL